MQNISYILFIQLVLTIATANFLKELSESLSGLLLLAFHWPWKPQFEKTKEVWKKMNASIFLKGTEDNSNNYGPISPTLILGKILKWLMQLN